MSIAATRSVRASASPPLAPGFAAIETGLVAVSGGRGWTPILEVMLDLLAFREIHGVLTDVGRKVRHALEIPAHQQELERL
jgi:hypothetical protein